MVYSTKARQSPLSETTQTEGESLYDRSKLACEAMLTSFCTAFKSKGIIFRPFSVYGKPLGRASSGHFIATWLEQARAGLPLVVDGGGRQTVDLIHIDDLARAAVAADSLELRAGEVEVFNLGSGRDSAVIDIARWIQSAFPGVELRFGPGRPHTIPRRWADIAKARGVLGFHPEVLPEAGIRALAALG